MYCSESANLDSLTLDHPKQRKFMKFSQALAQSVSVIVTSVGMICGVATVPTFAATLATSESQVNLDNFSHTPLQIETLTDTETVAVASDGQVTVDAIADATFLPNPSDQMTQAHNISLSTARGEGDRYLGLAESLAAVIGYNFKVEAGETFSFDFNAVLGLETSIDHPQFEQANAEADILLTLYESNGSFDLADEPILDFLSLSGELTTSKGGDFLNHNHSSSITYTPGTFVDTSFTDNQKAAIASVQGNFSRTFDSLTYLTLVEIKTNQANVKTTPEYSSLLALLVFCLISVRCKLKRQP
jgi:hypothetical protein